VQETQVVIIGAGPVGLTLAVDLGRRGIRCVLIEQKPHPEFLPKMERCNARTMELYRRIGLTDQIRAAGLPADVPMDVYVVLSMAEAPLLHLPYPSVAAMRELLAATNDGSQPAEPYQLISQYTLEPLLKSVAEGLRSVNVLYGHEFLELQQAAERVSATIRTRTATPRPFALPIWWDVTAAPAQSGANSASKCAARATCSSSGRRSTAATTCSSTFLLERVRAAGGIITSRTTRRAFL
jgi:2-polyprenyl-6-methoxyphenol hydroxylase-like FAD-dependent oxidoreductase